MSPYRQSLLSKGRPAIFRHKTVRLQGVVTKVGSVKFEHARRRLARLAGRDVDSTSDGDTFEFLARGEANTRRYLSWALLLTKKVDS